MTDLFNTGIRPAVDKWLLEEAAKERDYGSYWSASSAGYCQRKVIMERLGVPAVKEDARKQRVFTSGHIFHEWMQRITKDAGISIAQELELQDEELMIRGHIDDLVLVGERLILIDYKTQNSRAFSYQKTRANGSTEVQSHFHKMQLGTYMYMLRNQPSIMVNEEEDWDGTMLTEARILKISKDDLRMVEEQLMWTSELEKEVLGYWNTLNTHFKARTWPPCTCADKESGFMAKEAYNPFYYDGEPCSLTYFNKCKAEGLIK